MSSLVGLDNFGKPKQEPLGLADESMLAMACMHM